MKNIETCFEKYSTKAVRFFIKKLLLINIPTVEKTDFIRFLLRDEEKVLRKTHVKPHLILSLKSTAMT